MANPGTTGVNTIVGTKTWVNTNNVKVSDNVYANAYTGANWSNIFTYTTNATATLVTAWIGAAINTSPTIPAVINGQATIVNANSTFRANTALTNCFINANVAFVSNIMTDAFNACSNLVGVDAIPNSVTSMDSTFYSCTNLVNAPTIGVNVTSMYFTFYSCTNLVNAPTIGVNVTSMTYTFYSCTNLVNAPTIPNSVTSMAYTFNSCTNLVNAPTIPNSVTNMAYTFASCSGIVNAPTIGVNVTSMGYTFYFCTNLAGNITIVNANVTNFTACFTGCNASIAKTLRCPTGSASYNLAINVCNGINGVTVVAY